MNTQVEAAAEYVEVPEIDALKERAIKLGIKFHPNIGVDTLRDKVTQTLNGTSEAVSAPVLYNDDIPEYVESQVQLHARLRKEAARLVRVRVACMNPNKKEWSGEVFTVSNSVVGTFKKYIPFNNEEGWHIPSIILNVLKERECQIFVTVVGTRGMKQRKSKLIKEFSIEILDPLTETELKDLSIKQAMANNLD